MFVMRPKTICTYDIHNGLHRSFGLLETMLKDPRSELRLLVWGLKLGVAHANPTLMTFIEGLLKTPPESDQAGAERVLDAYQNRLIGQAATAEHADYPMILQYCQVHRQDLPLTCLMLLSYGHTREWTHAGVSQSIYPVYESLVEQIEITPMLARAVVEFTVADYELNDWLPDQVARALPRLLFANDVLRRAARLDTESLGDARAKLTKAVKHFSTKTGPLTNRLRELTSAARSPEEFEVAHSMLDFITDHAEQIWPFEGNIAPVDLFLRFSEFFTLNERGAKDQLSPHPVFDQGQACTWMLKAIAGSGSRLSSQFCCKSMLSYDLAAHLLSEFMVKVDGCAIDSELKQSALLNMAAGLANWIGIKNFERTQVGIEQQNEILRLVFRAEQLPSLESLLSDHGRRVMTSFVMAEQRPLAGRLRRQDRGRHLEYELGL